MTNRRDIALIDDFVGAFSNLDDLTCFHDQPPPDLLLDAIEPDDWHMIRWKPARLSVQRTGVELLRRAGPLPDLFEHLASWYAWLDIDLQACRFFSNPPSPDLDLFANSMFGDPVMNNTLLPARFVRFALAPDSCYDPICFDLSRFDGRDCPVVRFEHESILYNDRLGDRETLFDSFRGLVFAVIDAGRTKKQIRDRTKP